MKEFVVVAEPRHVADELKDMDLSLEKLLDVLAYADSERALCTSNDIKGFDLIITHDKAARGLRETFCGPSWERDETDNQPGIRHPGLKLRIIPSNFDINAGNPDPAVTPTNLREKGAASSRKVRCNQTPYLPGLLLPQPGPSDWKTWILGISADDDGVGAELSLPLRFEGGKFSKFVKRIILRSRDSDSFTLPKWKPEAPTETVDIPVIRK